MASHSRSPGQSPDLPLPRRSASIFSQRSSLRSSLALSQAEPEDSTPVSFYNTTFSAHRVSPLYLGKEPLTARRLQLIAQRLRDTLVGDVVRGVEVGLGLDGEDPIMGRAGALEAVELRWVRMSSLLDISPASARGKRAGSRDLGSDAADLSGISGMDDWKTTAAALRRKNALNISLRYEAASCTALLLPELSPEDDKGVSEEQELFVRQDQSGEISADPKHFLSMPLLLLRMPAPLKAVIGNFLSTTFDCRVSPLRLGTRSIVRSWESWTRSVGLPTRGPLAKDVVLSIGFYIPPAEEKPDGRPGSEESPADQQLGLKSIEVFIPAEELRKFVDAGKSDAVTRRKRKPTVGSTWEDDTKKRRKLAGRLHEEGWEWRAGTDPDAGGTGQPFTEALGCYMDAHLGMNLFHPGVRITKIACGGFVISEGRIKIFAPADLGEASEESPSSPGQRGAVWEFLRDLVQKATVGTSLCNIGDFLPLEG